MLITGIEAKTVPELCMLKRTTAVVGISVLTALLAFSFFPGIVASGLSNTYTFSPNGCTVTWVNPTGTYSPGSTIAAYVSTTCAGAGSWIITSQPSGTLVASGTFMCGSGGCSSLKLYGYTAGTAPLTPGSYQYTAQFNGASNSFSFTVSTFTVTPQFPAGAILAVLAPIAALLGYAKFRKPAFLK